MHVCSIRYGFDHLYGKLRPLDRVSALEIAVSTQPSYLPKLMDKFACDFLLSDYNELLENYSSDLILQAMGIFHRVKYQRQELWQKLEEMLEGLVQLEVENRREEGVSESEPVFDKENLFILMKILGERRSPNTDLWSLVIENVDDLLTQEAFDLKEIS